MSEPVVIRSRLAAEPERVFAAFVEQTAAWWVPRPTPWGTLGSAPILGKEAGAPVIEDGVDVGRIEVFLRGNRLVFTLHGSRVAVDFQPDGGGTRVTLTHSGFEGWLRGSRQVFVDVLGVYWMDGLRALHRVFIRRA